MSSADAPSASWCSADSIDAEVLLAPVNSLIFIAWQMWDARGL